jgi:hypothetical protein
MKKSRKTPVGVLNGNWRAGDYVAYRRQIEADAQRQIRVDALLAEERQLMEKCHDLEGDEFIAWYDSDAVPAYGVIQERINILKQRIAYLTEPQDPAQARRANILYALENEPVTKDEAIELIDELAEIEAKRFDWTPTPKDMPEIDMGNVEEVEF